MKSKTKKKIVKKSRQTPALKNNHTNYPSLFKIGQSVVLDFNDGGKLPSECIISGITFTEMKVLYDVDVLVTKAHKVEFDHRIMRHADTYITLKEVDSICVKPIKK